MKMDIDVETADTIAASQTVQEDDWLEQLFNTMSRRIVNDDEIKRLLYKVYCSRFCLDKPLNALVREEFSSGKSYISTEVAKFLFPKRGEWQGVQVIEGMSKKFMYYLEDTKDEETGDYHVNLNHQVWLFTDIKDKEEIMMLRSMMSHDEYEREFKTLSDRRKRRNVKLQGFAVVVACTPDMRYDRELGSRCLLLSPNTSREKVKAVLDWQDEQFINPDTTYEYDVQHFQDCLFYLAAYGHQKFDIPKAFNKWKRGLRERLGFKNEVTDMRFNQFFQRLVLVTAWLNQFTQNKKRIKTLEDDSKMIEVQKEDFDAVVEEAEELLRLTVSGLSPSQLKFLDEVFLADENIPKTVWQLRNLQDKYYEIFGRSIDERTLKKNYLGPLEAKGYLWRELDEHDRRRYTYQHISREELEKKKNEKPKQQTLNGGEDE